MHTHRISAVLMLLLPPHRWLDFRSGPRLCSCCSTRARPRCPRWSGLTSRAAPWCISTVRGRRGLVTLALPCVELPSPRRQVFDSASPQLGVPIPPAPAPPCTIHPRCYLLHRVRTSCPPPSVLGCGFWFPKLALVSGLNYPPHPTYTGTHNYQWATEAQLSLWIVDRRERVAALREYAAKQQG